MSLLAIVVDTHAQEQRSIRLTISGHLTDTDSKEPLALATIQLFLAATTRNGATATEDDDNT